MRDRYDLPADLAKLATDMLMRGRRRPAIIGIAGPPGAGKSTLAEALNSQFNSIAVHSKVAAMDGFHLSRRLLTQLGLSNVRGSPATFDVDGFITLLGRLRNMARPVYAPSFGRSVREAVNADIRISAQTDIVMVDGNYLLLRDEPWCRVRPLLDLCVYLDIDWETCRRRLLERQISTGKNRADALEWVDRNDRSNYDTVVVRSEKAGCITVMDGRIAAATDESTHESRDSGC